MKLKIIYAQHERFFWVKAAALLDKTDIIVQSLDQLDQRRQEKFWANEMPKELLARLDELPDKEYAKEISQAIASNPTEIRDYCKVRQSLNMATTRLIHLLREEVSLGDLDTKANEKGQVLAGGVRLDEKKIALRHAAVKGNIDDRLVYFAIAEANEKRDSEFFKNLGRALLSKKRPPEIDYERISIVPRFLVDYWCGDKGVYGMWINLFKTANIGDWRGDNGAFVWNQSQSFFFHPPLCFFSNGALATFCAMILGKNQSDPDTSTDAIRKWVSRLGLVRAKTPKIREVNEAMDGIWFA